MRNDMLAMNKFISPLFKQYLCLTLSRFLSLYYRFLTMTLACKMTSWALHIFTWSPWNNIGPFTSIVTGHC